MTGTGEGYEAVDACGVALAEALRQTRTYEQYERLLAQIRQEPELKERVDAYRMASFELQTDDDGTDTVSSISKLEQEYAQMLEQPLARRYLDSELELCRLIQRVFMGVLEDMDFA